MRNNLPAIHGDYQRPGWGEINLDFSGTRSAADAVHHNIAALTVDDALVLRQEQPGNWVLCDTQGGMVGKLSRSFIPPKGMHCIKARVAAIHVRRLKDVGEEHKARIRDPNRSWEMVVPEFVFAPTR